MAEQKSNPDLTIKQVVLTEDNTAGSLSSETAILASATTESITPAPLNQGELFTQAAPQVISQEVSQQSSKVIDKASPKIVLATLNARFFHTSFGLRYLYANLKELQQYCEIKEFIIQTRDMDIVEQILASKPDIVGFGVYIWNIVETTAVVNLLKVIAPEIKVVLGGPEVSYETEHQAIVACADYVLTGPADVSFYQLC